MSRQTLWEWRQEAGFREWLRTSLDEDQTLEFRYAIATHLGQAIQGNAASFRILAKLKEHGVF
jgi:hypothetical protein